MKVLLIGQRSAPASALSHSIWASKPSLYYRTAYKTRERQRETPVAVIRWGTTSRQKTVVGTLITIVQIAKDIKPPAITIVGEVVKLRDQLNWFETKPLFGKTIVVTRSREQAAILPINFTNTARTVIEFPTIEIAKPDDVKPLDEAIKAIHTFNWLVFTSTNGVDSFFQRLLSWEGTFVTSKASSSVLFLQRKRALKIPHQGRLQAAQVRRGICCGGAKEGDAY